ncbi:hypothetical protein J437_LFUL007849 [Ladona fulva]|uniref:Uncharacterized protein n=1 Tax=Ladona fulva TaxID=123851 RepID=A0A8K0K848_LADFU|nr:hypothetical protein J437_LFUL007849 [Ladona fulva]
MQAMTAAKTGGASAKNYRRIPWLAAAVLVLLGVAAELWSPAEGKPDPGQLAAMADALKYLQELDKYYSQVARPSFWVPQNCVDRVSDGNSVSRMLGHIIPKFNHEEQRLRFYSEITY